MYNVGYDTVHLWLGTEHLDKPIPIQAILNVLDTYRENKEVKQEVDMQTGEVILIERTKYSGTIGNLNVYVSNAGISIQNSFGKFYSGDIKGLLNPSNMAEAIQYLSEMFQLPLHKARVTRVDVAKDVILEKSVKTYFHYMGNAGRMERQNKDNGIYYSTSKRTLVLYDKGKQLIKEVSKSQGRLKFPEEYRGKNVLRLEYRLLKDVAGQLNTTTITAEMLTQKGIYQQLIAMWYKAYIDIEKNRSVIFDHNVFNSIKDFMTINTLMNFENLGGQLAVLREIEQARLVHNLSPLSVKRLKDKVKEVYKHPLLTQDAVPVQELDGLVALAVQQALTLGITEKSSAV